MKPLSEWTVEELAGWIACYRARMGRQPADVLAELLRRERAKVAAEVRAFPSCRPNCEKVGLCECYSYLSFDLLAAKIERGPQ